MENKNCNVVIKYEFRTLTDLPYEVLEQILSYRQISHVELCRIAQVCRKFVGIANSNELWRRKFLQAWKPLYKLFKGHDVDWKQEFRQMHGYEKIVTDSISRMRGLILYSNQAQNYALGEFRTYFDGHKFASYLFTDGLERRIHDGNRNTNLTDKYYGTKLLHFVRQEHLLRLLQQHINKDADYNKIEIGTYLIAHFCQPGLKLSQETISDQLDDIALKVRAKLRESYPEHPALRRDLIPPGNILDKTLWTDCEGLVILHAINTVLYEDLKFRCMSLCDLSIDHIFINQVLETKVGTPIVLSIIYAAVAHRLGVRCVHIISQFDQLKCLESPELDDTKTFLCVNVPKNGAIDTVQVDVTEDAFSSRILESNPLMLFQAMVDHIADYATVLRRVENQQLLRFYESCALELHSYLAPNTAARKMAYVEDLLACDAKLFDVLDLLEQFKLCEDAAKHLHTYERLHKRAKTKIDKILEEFSEQQKFLKDQTPKKWFRENGNISYAVGMIMMNKTSKKICVIDGWEFRKNRERPVYHVITEDGKQGYLPEEYLTIYSHPRPIEHTEIGKFFEEFCGTHYIPNEAKAAEYPEDSAAVDTILETHFAQSKNASTS